jgi:hypothetical protein
MGNSEAFIVHIFNLLKIQEMKKALVLFLFMFPAWLTASYGQTAGAPRKPGTYHTHEEIIDMFRKECEKFPSKTEYMSIGKTTNNNDIWAFRFGNPKGGKIIIDGCLHGWEDLGTELTYVWIKWLMESNDPLAKKILKNNCWIVIPVVNFDSYERGNADHNLCSGGVDLNRNFIHGWQFVEACKGDYNTSHGATAASEKETQVIRAFMEANKPSGNKKAVYINTHYGGGPWIHYTGNDHDDFFIPLRNRIISLWNENGVVLKNTNLQNYLPEVSRDNTPGTLDGDAADFGFQAITIETLNQNCIKGHKFAPIDDICTGQRGESHNPTYEVMQNLLYPIFRQFFIAVSESVSRKK